MRLYRTPEARISMALSLARQLEIELRTHTGNEVIDTALADCRRWAELTEAKLEAIEAIEAFLKGSETNT